MNVCELAADRPLVLAFVVPGVEQCERQIGVLDRVAPRFPGVAFAAVAVRGDRDAVRERGWRIAVGHDRDGARGERVRRRRLPVHHLRPARGRGGGLGADVPGRGGAGAARGGAAETGCCAGGGRSRVSGGDPDLVAGPVDPAVAAEHPGLAVVAARVPFAPGPTPPEVRERLRRAADRWRGPQAVALRTRPVPWAYRVLFRHLGLDPDVTRTPVEALVLERLLHGGFPCARHARGRARARHARDRRGPYALDAARVHGAVGITAGEKLALADEARADRAALLAAGRRPRAGARDARAAARRGRGAGGARPVRRGGGVDGGRRAPYS